MSDDYDTENAAVDAYVNNADVVAEYRAAEERLSQSMAEPEELEESEPEELDGSVSDADIDQIYSSTPRVGGVVKLSLPPRYV